MPRKSQVNMNAVLQRVCFIETFRKDIDKFGNTGQCK